MLQAAEGPDKTRLPLYKNICWVPQSWPLSHPSPLGFKLMASCSCSWMTPSMQLLSMPGTEPGELLQLASSPAKA